MTHTTFTTDRPVPEDFRPLALDFVLARLEAGDEPEATGNDGFPIFAGDPLRDAHLLLGDYLREAVGRVDAVRPKDFKPESVPSGRAVLALPPQGMVEVVRAAVARVLWYWKYEVREVKDGWEHVETWARLPIHPLVTDLLRQDMPLTVDDLLLVLEGAAHPVLGVAEDYRMYVPLDGILRAAARHVKRHGMPPALRDALRKLREAYNIYCHHYALGAGERKYLRRMDDLLAETVPDLIESGEPWADAAREYLEAAGPSAGDWLAQVEHARNATGSKPSDRWLKEARKLIDRVGSGAFREQAGRWLELAARPRTVPLRADQTGRSYGYEWYSRFDLFSEHNERVLKGMAWACAAAEDSSLSGALGVLAEACFRRIPKYGPRSPPVGNACLVALALLPGPEAPAELSRLKARVKQPTARKMIDKAIASATGQVRD